MSAIPLHVLHLPLLLIPPKISVLVVLNSMHLAFLLASVSDLLRPTCMHADLIMAQVAIPALVDTSDIATFTEP